MNQRLLPLIASISSLFLLGGIAALNTSQETRTGAVMIWGGIAIHLASLISNLLFSSVLATGVVNLVATLHLAVLTVLVFPSALLVAFIILIVMYLTYWFPADEGQQSTIA